MDEETTKNARCHCLALTKM